MAVSVGSSVVLTIDIALAGVTPGETVVEVPHPETGQDLIARGWVMHRTAAPGEDGEGILRVMIGATQVGGSISVMGSPGYPLGVGVESSTVAAYLWPAGVPLAVVMPAEIEAGVPNTAAPDFVGLLYVEYYSSQGG